MEVERIDDMVAINEPVIVDNSIESYAYIDYNLQTLANINTDGAVLNFDIQAADRYLVPSKSFIVISGRLVDAQNNNHFAQADEVALINNAPMYLFKNASFEIAGEKVEYIDNLGQTTSILGYLS